MLETWREWLAVLMGIGGLLAALGAVWYCHVQMGRVEEMLAEFSGRTDGDDGGIDGKARVPRTKERRESKLIHQLEMILDRAAFQEQRAAKERDEVAGLLSDLSHQLKTPLANVVMYTELLEEGDLSEKEERSFLKETRHQAEKMQWLMKAMLKASRLEHGLIAVSADYREIRETIGRAVTAVYAQASDKKIAIEVKEETQEGGERRLYHDPVWTAEALGNILENAVKYSPEGSVVTVRIRPMEIYTGIEIEDQGMGIEEGEYSEIFKRFYRGKGSSSRDGNGLGLYLAQLILNKEKGYVTVRPGRDGGSCFTVYLLNETTGFSG